MSVGELPVGGIAADVETTVIPHSRRMRSISKPSPPMLYSPSRLILNLPSLGVSSSPTTWVKMRCGDVMARGLAHTLVTFATESEDVDAEFLFHFARDGMDIIAMRPTGQVAKMLMAPGLKSS